MLTVRHMKLATLIGTLILGALVGTILLGLVPQLQSGRGGQGQAMSACEGISDEASEYGTIAGVERAERSTAGDVAAWQEERLSTVMDFESELRKLDPTAIVDVCIFAGEFVTPTGSDADGNPNPPHSRLRLLILPDGSVRFESAGYADRMQPEMPSGCGRRDSELAAALARTRNGQLAR